MAISSKILSPALKWSVGSWSLFIAENFILSENRTTIISQVGDDNYHYIYGLCSTLAVSSIAYGYQYKVKVSSGPMLWKAGAPVPLPGKVAAFVCMSLGLGLISQSAPKLQIPLEYMGGSGNDSELKDQKQQQYQQKVTTESASQGDKKWKVRCPFDFTDAKSKSLEGGENVHGLDRITRHPGLWSFGLLGLGSSFLTPNLPMRAWLSMPIMVALIGGGHTDSRHRRGMGGQLNPEVDAITSNVPFAAILTGQQGDFLTVMGKVSEEVKGLNALLAMGVAASFVAKRGRGSSAIASRVVGSRFN